MSRNLKWIMGGLTAGVIAVLAGLILLWWYAAADPTERIVLEHVVDELWDSLWVEEDVPTFKEGGSSSKSSVGSVSTGQPGAQTMPRYFPPSDSAADNDWKMRREECDRFSEYLASFKEPSLYEASADKLLHSYRVTWLRTFHKPVCVRLERRGKEAPKLVAKRCNGAGGYNPGTIELARETTLYAWRFNRMVRSVEKSGFWNLRISVHGGGFDGSDWILEGVRNGKYHFVHWYCPKKGEPFREVCLEFLELGGVRGRPVY